MRPRLATENLANVLAHNAEVFGYPLVCGSPTAAANLTHNGIGQLVPVMILPARHVPMFHEITNIRGTGVPSQVGKAVIPGVPVVVASLASSRAWADERRENQPVNVVGLVDATGENQHDNLTAILVVGAGAQGSPCVAVSPFVLEARQDAPVCACGVSGESGDVRVSSLSAIFGERGECVCNHASDYTTHRPEREVCQTS